MKIVRTDRELHTPVIDAKIKEAGHQLVLLPGGITEDQLIEEILSVYNGKKIVLLLMMVQIIFPGHTY